MSAKRWIAFVFLSCCYSLAAVTLHNYTESYVASFMFCAGAYLVFICNFDAKGDE